jgi:hypothetical protein
MASASSSGRLGVVVAILGFVAGCWAGMGADESGDLYCVVTGESAATRPGAVPGQIVESTPDGDSGDDGDDGGACQAGEPRVCGQFEDGDEGEDRRFVSDECPDD